ncbi:DUF3833 family protein [Phyllobacterium sp. P5_D12]
MRQLLTIAIVFIASSLFTAALAKDLVLEKYFVGNTRAEGQFSAINGVKKSFKVQLSGRWNGKRLLLREDFTYADGEKDRKTWQFVKTSPTTYVGIREDVVGRTLVTVKGDTARFSYDVYLDGKTRNNRVRFHDKMTLKSDGVLINDAWVSKYGFPVACTHVKFRK